MRKEIILLNAVAKEILVKGVKAVSLLDGGNWVHFDQLF